MSTILSFDNSIFHQKFENNKDNFLSESTSSNLQKQNIHKKINLSFSKYSFDNSKNKNGSFESKKIESNNINLMDSKIKEEFIFLNNINLENKDKFLNSKKNRTFSCFNKNYSNSLESKNNFLALEGFSKIPEFHSHLYENYQDDRLYKIILNESHSISKLFRQKIKKENNNIYSHIQNFIKRLNNHNFCKCNCKSYSKPSNIIKTLPEEQNQTKEITFKIPENFLINYKIKKINIQNKKSCENEKNYNDISIKDIENFINNICKNKSENYFDFSDEDFIEYKNINFEEERNDTFINKKRKRKSFNSEEFENYWLNRDINEIQLKKTNKKNKKIKKKLNNKKDGDKINIYLNQIKINKNYLEYFPLCPMKNISEIFKIELLEGIFEDDELLRIKKNVKIIKDERYLQSINNKKFEIIYQKEESDSQCILHINGINILYIILYYYLQIQQGLKLREKFLYSKQKQDEWIKADRFVENLIEKCNKISKEIIENTQ